MLQLQRRERLVAAGREVGHGIVARLPQAPGRGGSPPRDSRGRRARPGRRSSATSGVRVARARATRAAAPIGRGWAASVRARVRRRSAAPGCRRRLRQSARSARSRARSRGSPPRRRRTPRPRAARPRADRRHLPRARSPARVLHALADGAEPFDERADRDAEHEPGGCPEDHEQVDREDGALGQARFDGSEHPVDTLPRRSARQTPGLAGEQLETERGRRCCLRVSWSLYRSTRAQGTREVCAERRQLARHPAPWHPSPGPRRRRSQRVGRA